MQQELNLNFQNSQQVTISLVQHPPVTVDFAIPLTAQDREAIRHYLEVYAAQYVMDIDDTEAQASLRAIIAMGAKTYLMRYLIMYWPNNYSSSLSIRPFQEQKFGHNYRPNARNFIVAVGVIA
jgi:hypothetical protein